MCRKICLVLLSIWIIPQLDWRIWLNMWPELETTFQAESRLNPKAYNWDNGAEARGLAQITKKYHPEVSDVQAYNPWFSIAWGIDVFVKGNAAKEWTCYRKLFVENQDICN